MRGRDWAPLIAAVLVTAGGLACAPPDAGAPGAGVFRIGVLLPLTGATAWGGRPARVAAEMAAAAVAAQGLAGPRAIELVFADGACEPRTSYAAADKLIHQDRVQFLIGEWCSSASIAAAQVATDAQVPMLVHISTADDIARNAGPYVFQSIIQNSVIQAREARLLLDTFDFSSAAILVENNDFGLSFRDNMRRAFEAAGIAIVLDIPQDRQDVNWYSTITRIRAADPDLVVVSVSAGQAANFVKQYAESHVTTPLFSDYTPPPYIFEEQVGLQAGEIGLVRGTFFLSHPDMTARQRAFVEAFEPLVERELGEPRPTVHWDMVTYDAVMIVADALRRARTTGAADLLEALADTHHEGALGTYAFDADRAVRPEGFGFLFIRTTPTGGLEIVR
jgi:branched-chain amino acid transport system substrate-binding protein